MEKEKQASANLTFTDPVCGMTVKPETAAGSLEHNGETVYFCSTGCLQKFVAQTSGETAAQPNLVQLTGKKETAGRGDHFAAPGGGFIDRVCGMSVAPETAAGKYDFRGETFYFCSTGCLAAVSVLIIACPCALGLATA